MSLKIVQPAPQMKRGIRSPRLSFNVVAKPWQIVPVMFHPVLPGETLKNLLLMSRVVSDPLKDKLCGWWCEYFFFYVKHRDLPIRDDLVEMHLDASKNMAPHNAAANVKFFHNGGIPFAKMCYDEIVKWYFRDEVEREAGTWSKAIDGYEAAKINVDGWWQSLKLESAMPAPAEDRLPGDNPQMPDNAPAGFSAQYAQWEAMRAAGITDVTFEDYLATFGVKVPSEVREDLHRPELIRYAKNFTYPTNTVEPTTGEPSSAAVWSISERADKDRFFREPGFVIGVQVIRPKVYLNAITGSVTSYMNHAFNWLPKVLQDMAFMSLKEFGTGAGPAPVAFGEDYWVDLRDLLLYGEQFVNHAGNKNEVALPAASGNVEFASLTDSNALFLATDAAKRWFRTDGMVNANIASAIKSDYTP